MAVLPGAADLLVVEPDYTLAAWGPLIVLVWRANTVLGAKAVHNACRAHGSAQPKGACIFTILEPDVLLARIEARDELAALIREGNPYVNASAIVFEGDGFSSATVRALVTGSSLMARQEYPQEVFATVAAAVAWLVPRLEQAGLSCSAAQIVRTIDDVRQRRSPA